MSFKEVSFNDLQLNPATLIGKEWLLITAGNETAGYNTMTASWGHLGTIWKRPGDKNPSLPTAVTYIRPQRYTKEFVDREDIYTLTFFDETYKKALGYLGSHSGRDEDKVAKAGLTPVFSDGTTYFEEAKMVLICRKLYRAPLVAEGFIDKSLIDICYENGDFHDMYVGEILKVLVKE